MDDMKPKQCYKVHGKSHLCEHFFQNSNDNFLEAISTCVETRESTTDEFSQTPSKMH